MARYVLTSLNEENKTMEEINIDDFFSRFLSFASLTSPNFKFCFDILTFYEAIKIFDMGVKRNNAEYYQCGLDNFRTLWHIRNHPIYRILIESYEHTKNVLPVEILNWMNSTLALLTHPNDTTGQAPDFRQEENNQITQNLLPPGAPSVKTWNWVYRQTNPLLELRNSWFEEQGLKDPKIKEYSKLRCEENLSPEIEAFRVKLRKSNYVGYQGVTDLKHASLSGNQLHPNLRNILQDSKEARRANLQTVLSTRTFLELSKTSKLTFTTENDEIRWKSRSLKALVEQIEQRIKNIPSQEDQESWNQLWVPWKALNTKESAISFLEKLNQNDIN